MQLDGGSLLRPSNLTVGERGNMEDGWNVASTDQTCSQTVAERITNRCFFRFLGFLARARFELLLENNIRKPVFTRQMMHPAAGLL